MIPALLASTPPWAAELVSTVSMRGAQMGQLYTEAVERSVNVQHRGNTASKQ